MILLIAIFIINYQMNKLIQLLQQGYLIKILMRRLLMYIY